MSENNKPHLSMHMFNCISEGDAARSAQDASSVDAALTQEPAKLNYTPLTEKQKVNVRYWGKRELTDAWADGATFGEQYVLRNLSIDTPRPAASVASARDLAIKAIAKKHAAREFGQHAGFMSSVEIVDTVLAALDAPILPLMRTAFVTSSVTGGEEMDYQLVFTLPDHETLNRAHDEWLAFAAGRATPARTLDAPSEWAGKDMSMLIHYLREKTQFDADLLAAMLKFAIDAAGRAATPQQAIPGDKAEGGAK